MSEELDKRCARAMGLEIIHEAWPCGVPPDGCSREAALRDDGDLGPWFNERGPVYKIHEPIDEWRAELGFWCDPIPAYSSDATAARTLEDEIERRGLWYEYVAALLEQADPTLVVVDTIWTKIVRATPEQKCRAFLEAVK